MTAAGQAAPSVAILRPPPPAPLTAEQLEILTTAIAAGRSIKHSTGLIESSPRDLRNLCQADPGFADEISLARAAGEARCVKMLCRMIAGESGGFPEWFSDDAAATRHMETNYGWDTGGAAGEELY